MRIYEGSPRQDFEEVFRSIGAQLDVAGMREILVLETDEGFIVQGLVHSGATGTWSDAIGAVVKQTLTIADDEMSAFMDQAVERRGQGTSEIPRHYESALRVIGQYLDDRRPRDIFFFEQDGAFVLRLLIADQTGTRHELVEFTRDDIAEMVGQGPTHRVAPMPARMGTPR